MVPAIRGISSLGPAGTPTVARPSLAGPFCFPTDIRRIPSPVAPAVETVISSAFGREPGASAPPASCHARTSSHSRRTRSISCGSTSMSRLRRTCPSWSGVWIPPADPGRRTRRHQRPKSTSTRTTTSWCCTHWHPCSRQHLTGKGRKPWNPGVLGAELSGHHAWRVLPRDPTCWRDWRGTSYARPWRPATASAT